MDVRKFSLYANENFPNFNRIVIYLDLLFHIAHENALSCCLLQKSFIKRIILMATDELKKFIYTKVVSDRKNFYYIF